MLMFQFCYQSDSSLIPKYLLKTCLSRVKWVFIHVASFTRGAFTLLSTKQMDSLPSLPSDPALFDNWEEHLNPTILPSSTNSDDFEALHQIHEESIARKNKAGEVIQHRRWQLGEAFRSETDFIDGINHQIFKISIQV